MKLSIWRQFSSNHSGSFAVVGLFANENQAKAAADKLANIIHRIDQWHENPDNQAWYEEEAPSSALTAVEEAIRTEYALDEWDHQAADWYGSVHDPVRHVGCDVFFSVGDTWSSPQPIHNLIEKLGGTSYDQHEFGGPITNVFVNLTCTFDSPEAATQADILLRPWFENHNTPPPWTEPDQNFYDLGYGRITCDSNRLQISLDDQIESLPNLLTWLLSRGAYDFDYSLEMQNTYPE